MSELMFSLPGPHNPWNHRTEFLRERLAENPDDSIALALLASTLSSRGRREEALGLARRAVELDSDNAYAHYVMSCVLVASPPILKRSVEEAVAAIDRAIAIDAENPTYHGQRAYLHYLLGLRSLGWRPFYLSLEAAEEGLRIDAGNVYCAFLRGLVLQRLRRYTDADTALGRAVEIDPNAAHLRVAYGQCLLNCGKLSAAIEQWREAARLQPALSQHQVRLRNALAVKRVVELPTALALRLRLVRFPDGSRAERPRFHVADMNWSAGLALALTIVASVEVAGMTVGEHSGLLSAVLCGLTAVFGAIFVRSTGWARIICAVLTAFCGVMWLEMSFLLLVSPQHMSAAAKQAWPQATPGAIFHVARVAGLAGVIGMAIFLGAFAKVAIRRATVYDRER